MKIAFITHNLNTKDGGGRFSHDLVENLRNNGIESVVIIVENTVPLLNFFKIRKIFKNSDIIHAIDIWPNGFYARLISVGLKKPIIVTALGTYSIAPFYSWRRLLAKWVLKNIKLIAISDYTKEKILEVIPKLKIEVVTPGFNLDFWSRKEVRFQESPEVGLRYQPYILSVGALKLRKGYRNSIMAFAIVAKKIENLNYIIVGQGEEWDYAKELKGLLKENGLEKRVLLVSNGVDDNQLLLFYRNAEMFILTPTEENHHFEGFGIVYLEAAASGLPVIGSLNSGAMSAVRDSYNGLLVPQNDPEKTAGAIIKILENPELKSSFCNNSRGWVKEFSWGKIIKKYIEIYNAKHY